MVGCSLGTGPLQPWEGRLLAGLSASPVDPSAPLLDLELDAADEAGYQVVEEGGDKPADEVQDTVEDGRKLTAPPRRASRR